MTIGSGSSSSARPIWTPDSAKKAAHWFAKAVAAKLGEEKVYLEISKAYADSQALM